MDETTFRILDTLYRKLGQPMSISKLTDTIKELHGIAYYANIYEKLQALTTDNIIKLEKVGNSSVATLNFQNYLLIDMLTELELRRKQDLLKGRTELQMLFMEMDTYCKDLPLMKSVCAIKPEKNIKLNRMELLFLLQAATQDMLQEHKMALRKIIQQLQSIHNIRIDYIILNNEEFLNLLKSGERNSITEMLSDKIAFVNPHAFWIEIKDALNKGIKIRIDEEETNPAKIAEKDLVYNLARFGYKEIGLEIKSGENICIEYIIISILMRNEVRRIEAIPIILAKNKTNYNLLIFLSQKYGMSGKLLGLLKVLNKLKPAKETQEAIMLLESAKIKEIKVNERSIKEKMRLYNVT